MENFTRSPKYNAKYWAIENIMARQLDRNVLVWGIFTILIATLDVSTKVIDSKYYKQYLNKWNRSLKHFLWTDGHLPVVGGET